MRPNELGAVERQLWNSFTQGTAVDVRDGTSVESAIRADVIEALLLGAGADPAPGDRPALRLTGARITGSLDLRFAEIAVPVVLADCRFDEVPLLHGARLRELALPGSSLPGLAADMAQIDGLLVLSRCHLTGPLILNRAEIHGDLDLRDTVITAPGAEAISAVHVAIGGDTLCTNLAVQGGFRVSGASIDGEFDLEGASLSNPGGNALDAYHIQITEGFTFHPGFRAEGRIILSGATVPAAIGFCGAVLNNAGDVALEAVDVHVTRNFDLGRGLAVNGGIKLDGSNIGTQLSFRDATLTHPGDAALSLRMTQARETDLRTQRPIDGTVDARNAQLGTLYDTPDTWPADIRLAETTYDALASPWQRPNGSTGSGAAPTATSRSRTNSSQPRTGGSDTRTKHARCCWRSNVIGALRFARTSASGVTSRTRPSATATGLCAPASGSWLFSPVVRSSSQPILPDRSKRERHRRSTPSSTRSTCWSPSLPSGRKRLSHHEASVNGSPTG